MPTRVTQSAPKAWHSAVRCGTAVIVHHAQRHADDRAEHEADGDPLVVDDAVVKQRADDRQQHAELAGPDAAARGGRRAHPLEREDEQSRGDQVRDFDEVSVANHGSWFLGAAGLEHLEHAVGDDESADDVAGGRDDRERAQHRGEPRLPSPARMIAPTTAMASSALVSDISGVCSSGETRRITSKPMNAASMKTYKAGQIRSESSSVRLLLADAACSAGRLEKFAHARVDDFAAVRDQRLADDFVLADPVAACRLSPDAAGRR